MPRGKYKRTPKRSAYRPGDFDKLLPMKEWATGEKISRVTIESDERGLAVVEHRTTGQSVLHRLGTSPMSIDMILPSGEQIWIEIRSVGKAEPMLQPANLLDSGKEV